MKKKIDRHFNTIFNGTEDGFTLLELIVTLTILTIIVVLAFGAFRLGIKAWETGDERVDFFYRMKYLVDLMGKEISSIHPYYFQQDNKNEDKKLAFQGQPNLISFISSTKSSDLSLPTDKLRKVSFYFEEDKKLLIMTEEIIQLYNPFSKTGKKKIRSITLSKDISDLRFRYYVLNSVNSDIENDGEWVANFSSNEKDINKDNLPRAVEVTIATQTQKEGINKKIETFYLPSFIILLNAGMEFRFFNIE
ncbi:MAG TPA: prepilin-type N-terminal cleavage/methylation domain-containing protein [Nitrospinota bacterium]|nr:prepilin-type N-terminal cleavage/methylation domain-containing protein [Nitrospinota bacterium]HJN03286.1 prepilin-type N-terminal cleavage/methylation domain-containing protein [Nitrospinota bacterium]